MKSISGGLTTHITGETTSLTTCWKLKRTDGVILAATSLDTDVPFDLSDGDGVLTYKAATGHDRSALDNTADFKVDNMEVQGLIESSTVTKADVRAELYDYAEVKIFQVNFRDLTQNELKMTRGFLGQVSLKDTIFVAELRGLMQLYAQEIGDIITPECIADLFDTKCKVKETPPVRVGSTAYTLTDINDANVGSYVRPATPNDRYFRCTVAGTSAADFGLELEDGAGLLQLEDGSGNLILEAATGLLLEDGAGLLQLEDATGVLIFEGPEGGEPLWNLTLGGTTVDGTVTWTAVRANQIPATVDIVTDRRVFTINGIPATDAPDIFFREGLVLFSSGLNSNLVLKREVKDWDLSLRQVTLWRPMPFDVVSGDALDMSSGCNKSTGVCNATYLNIFNYRGRPHVPGENRRWEAPYAGS
jgi:uncharacterized phage protein (TIGR02218 family)